MALNDEQVRQISTSLGQLQRIDIACMNANGLERFLQPPVTARWQDISSVWLSARAEALLVTLPSLTTLYVLFDEDRPHLDFLSQLPQLKILEVRSKKEEDELHGHAELRFRVPPAALLKSLLPCTGITELDLNCDFSSAQWSKLFAKLTSLTKLMIYGELDSLECFASGPITESLEDLTLYNIDLSPSDLAHLYALKKLRVLALNLCFSLLDDATLDSLSPPTALIPTLTELYHEWRTTDEEHKSDYVERNGPSYEWMQKQLAQ